MTAFESMRRYEQSFVRRRAAWLGLGAFVLVALMALSFAAGYRYRGHDQEQEDATKLALKKNAEHLGVATVHRDSTKKEAAAAAVASDTHRDSSRVTVGQLKVTSPTEIQVGELPPLVVPKLAVDAILDLKESRRRDSVTVASLRKDVRALEVKDSLWKERDSLHVVREGQLEQDVRDAKADARRAERRGLVRGFIRGVGAAGMLVAGVVAAIVIDKSD